MTPERIDEIIGESLLRCKGIVGKDFLREVIKQAIQE
jgi:hypothetical protein